MKFKLSYLYISLIILVIPLTFFIIYKSTSNNHQFNKCVVFYPQHQDDEVLWAGSTIINALNKRGQDNVFVVLVSNGSEIAVFDKYDKYKDLSIEQKREIRNKEFLASLKALGVKEDNIIFLTDKNPTGTANFNLLEKTALEFENKYKSVTHIAHTYKYDWHLQHLKNGSTIINLYNAGLIKDAKFFVKPRYEYMIPEDKKIIYSVTKNSDYNKIKNACKEYMIIDESAGKEGIGYKSDNKSFDALLNDYSAKSILHLPGV